MSDLENTLVITVKVNKENMAEMPKYVEAINPIMQQFGGKKIAEYGSKEQLRTAGGPDKVVIIEFKDKATIQELVKSEGFTALEELRSRVFTDLTMSIC